MKAITLWQPWASLVALGVKRIETRSWSTAYRGPLLIHAAAKMPPIGDVVGEWSVLSVFAGQEPRMHQHGGRVEPMPLGAVVAVADLVDCIPTDDTNDPPDDCLYVTIDGRGLYRQQVVGDPWKAENVITTDLTDQLPYGDYSLNRYGWLLDNIRPLTEPVPMRGRQRLWNPDPILLGMIEERVSA